MNGLLIFISRDDVNMPIRSLQISDNHVVVEQVKRFAERKRKLNNFCN